MYLCMFVRDNLENGSMDFDNFFNTMYPDMDYFFSQKVHKWALNAPKIIFSFIKVFNKRLDYGCMFVRDNLEKGLMDLIIFLFEHYGSLINTRRLQWMIAKLKLWMCHIQSSQHTDYFFFSQKTNVPSPQKPFFFLT